MRGVVFIAAALIVVVLSIGACILPLNVLDETPVYASLNLLALEIDGPHVTESFDKDIACDEFVNSLRATAAMVILTCVATGSTIVLIVLHLLGVLKPRLPLMIGSVLSTVFSIAAVGIEIHEVTSVYCGNAILNNFLHLSRGFASMVVVTILIIPAALIAIFKPNLGRYSLPLFVSSFILAVGSCLLEPIAGETQGVHVDITLFHIVSYVIISTIKIADYPCSEDKNAYGAVAAFIILTVLAAGGMVIAEVVCMFRRMATRWFSIGATALTALLALIAVALQLYGFLGTFCGEQSSKDQGAHLAGAFVCSVLVFVATIPIGVLTWRDGGSSGGSIEYSMANQPPNFESI